ncbi:MAG: hypothetical protein M4579_002098 [Chaenotheca gracillima]|nr:MAG: hypothetical protein M4579_002098 [Chaenotheca gracillima]
MTAPTVTDLKKSFLNAQIRGPLSGGFEVGDGVLRRVNAAATAVPRGGGEERVDEEEELDPRVVEEVLKGVYSSQAIRHVAEQIDALYWASGEGESRNPRQDGPDALEKSADLRLDENITALPDEWMTEDEEETGDQSERERYIQLQDRLKALNAQRNTARQRLATYRDLETRLQPLQNPRQNVQPNLVTKNGELGKELERMRILMARVAGRIEGLKGEEEQGDAGRDVRTKSELEKLDQILGR